MENLASLIRGRRLEQWWLKSSDTVTIRPMNMHIEAIEGVAGVDEVGRGPLAGPVVAAAVMLHPDDPMLGHYRDSKKLSAKRRLILYHHLRHHAAARAIGMASVEEIDRLNILQATLLAMRRAVAGLRITPQMVLIDGNQLPQLPIPARAIVGGDDSVQPIAAASIMAKEVRDRLMRRLDHYFPGYGLARHKGYPTRVHLDALAALGVTPIHRTSFAPVKRCNYSAPYQK
ncbi:MAG: ribonuclease HII [Mariprofundales bacterium]|nr:ribonuclease HII [Mariprofundales bacterium]